MMQWHERGCWTLGWALVVSLAIGLVQCYPPREPPPEQDDTEPSWTEVETTPSPPTIESTDQPDATPPAVTPSPPIQAPDQVVIPIEAPVPPARTPTLFPLKERFFTHQQLRRQVRLERHFRLHIESSIPADAEGASETTREYIIEVQDATGGQMQRATINVISDTRRVLPVGENRPRLTVETGPLQGVRLSCQLSEAGDYQCDAPESAGPIWDFRGIVPQRMGMWPGRMVSIAETWELTGREAAVFLDIPDASALIQFALEDTDAAFRDELCSRVAYSLDGTCPIQLMGQTHTAGITGRGEYYYCEEQNLVLFHRQERTVSLDTNIRRGDETLVLEREVSFVMEEETSPQIQ